MHAGLHADEPSPRFSSTRDSLSIGEAAEALGLLPSAVRRSIQYIRSGGTLLGNMDIDFENGCFRKIG